MPPLRLGNDHLEARTIPAKAAQKPLITYAITFILVTLMPESLEASSLEPTA